MVYTTEYQIIEEIIYSEHFKKPKRAWRIKGYTKFFYTKKEVIEYAKKLLMKELSEVQQ